MAKQWEMDLPGKESMQTFQRYAVTAVFTLTCFAVPVAGAVPGEAESAGVSSVAAPSVGSGVEMERAVGESAGSELPVAGSSRSKVSGVEEAPGAEKPEWVSGASLADQVRELTEQFKREQKELLVQYQDLMKRARDARAEERDRIREQIQGQFDEFRKELMARQKRLRDDVRERFEEFRKRHPEHRELIESVKDRARERVRERRGQGGD